MINNLLKLCFLFEQKIIKNSHRLNYYHFGVFKAALEELIKIDISDETLTKWLDLNLPDLEVGFFNLNKQTNNDIRRLSKPPYQIISIVADDPIDLKVSNSKLLLGVDNIPNLYYFEGNQVEYVNRFVMEAPKNLSKYMFLLEAIAAIANIQTEGYLHYREYGYSEDLVNDKFISTFINFIKEHEDKITKMLNIASQHPKYLGSGTDSVVFDLGQYILKIFSSTNLYEDTIKQLHKLYTQPEMSRSEMMIHDIDYIGNFNYINSFPIYYMITEKMEPILNTPDKIYQYIKKAIFLAAKQLKENTDDWIEWRNFFDSKKTTKEQRVKIINQIKSYAEYIATNIELTIDNNYEDMDISEAMNNYVYDGNLQEGWLQLLIEEIIIKLVTRRGDLHEGNLGITKNKELKYFDSAHQNWTEKINNPGWDTSGVFTT